MKPIILIAVLALAACGDLKPDQRGALPYARPTTAGQYAANCVAHPDMAGKYKAAEVCDCVGQRLFAPGTDMRRTMIAAEQIGQRGRQPDSEAAKVGMQCITEVGAQ